MATVTVMRPDRTTFEIDDYGQPEGTKGMLADFGYVMASDGVYVPKCDREQYERGGRPVAVDDSWKAERLGTAVVK